MSMIVRDLRDAGQGLLSRARFAVAAARRTTAPVLLLRLLIFVALVVAWVLVLPPSLLAVAFVLFAVPGSALAAALFPRTLVVGLVIMAIAAAWLLTTLAVDVSHGRVLALAAALYVAHAAAAFAAVLPHDTAVAPSALGKWAVRTLLVLVVSLGLGAAGLYLTSHLPVQQHLIGAAVGAAVAIGLVALITWLVRRRS